VFLAAVPFIFLMVVFCLFRLDFPYLDQWEFVPLLAKSFDGTLGFADFWAQHNEHRLVFPRLIMLVLARLSHWNVLWEMVVTIALAVVLFLLLAREYVELVRAEGRKDSPWALVLISLLVFSLAQWENWFLGWQLQELLSIVAAVAGILILAHGRGETGHLAASACGIVATFSFANGLIFWMVGLGLVLFYTRERAWKRVWGEISFGVFFVYLYGFRQPSYHPGVAAALFHPIDYALYVLAYLGAPVMGFSEVGAVVAGLAGLMTLALLAWRNRGTAALPVCLAFGAYAAGSAAFTGLGRVGFGTEQAMSPRYVTFANLIWIAIAMLASVGPREAAGSMCSRIARALAVLAFAGLVSVSSLHGAYRWTERYHYRIDARQELLDGNDLDMLGRIHPEPQKIIRRRPILMEHGLSIFHERAR